MFILSNLKCCRLKFGLQHFSGVGIHELITSTTLPMLIYRTRPFCCCLLIINMPLSMRNCLIGSNRQCLDCFTSFFVIVFRDLNLAELHGWENSPPCSGEGERRRGEDNESELVSDLLLIFLTSTTLTFFSLKFVCINTRQLHLPALSKKTPLPTCTTQLDNVHVSWTSL